MKALRCFLALLAVSLAVFAVAQPGPAETCRLDTYASSWMSTGTPFSVACSSGKYSGHLVSTPARRRLPEAGLRSTGNGVTSRPQDEGKLQLGHGRQIANRLTAGGTGIGAKDLTDGLSGAMFKSWYMIPASCVTLAFFSNGGDVLLKPGYKLELVSLKGPPTPAAPQSSASGR